MCLNLQTIKNPSYNKTIYASELGSFVTVSNSMASQKEYIQVPCGKCAECKQNYINSILQRAIVESLFSYVYFVTLTYDNKHIPCLTINGENFYFANYDHLQFCIKRFRNYFLGKFNRDFRYLAVNEYGDNKHRPHFHILFFVSKLSTDNEVTPKEIEKYIFEKLADCWSINVGTYKFPVYERLFTYRCKYGIDGKIKSNYYVKFVDSSEFNSFVNECGNNELLIQDDSNIKSIRYLVGYVNKPNKYEEKLECLIDNFKEIDPVLYRKYRQKLKSQVRFSKGFGCGFIEGRKYYLPKISIRCSSNSYVYSETVQDLPDTWEEFVQMYPGFSQEIIKWRNRDYYSFFSRWDWCKNGMSVDEYICHCVYLKYFPKEFSDRYNRFKRDLKPKISTYYNVNNRSLYGMSVVKTYKIEESLIYNYLRSGVEEGISKGVPFLAFKMIGQQTYMPLCKYYRSRVTTYNDLKRLYDKLGVKNYDEWLLLFQKVLSAQKVQKQSGNVFKYYSTDFVDSDDVNKYNIYELI